MRSGVLGSVGTETQDEMVCNSACDEGFEEATFIQKEVRIVSILKVDIHQSIDQRF